MLNLYTNTNKEGWATLPVLMQPQVWPLCEKGFLGQNVAIGFELFLSQDTIVCFDALESVPYNLFQSAILANCWWKEFLENQICY